jgi:hypothetical protein
VDRVFGLPLIVLFQQRVGDFGVVDPEMVGVSCCLQLLKIVCDSQKGARLSGTWRPELTDGGIPRPVATTADAGREMGWAGLIVESMDREDVIGCRPEGGTSPEISFGGIDLRWRGTAVQGVRCDHAVG